jgi:hypothetical protein
MSAEDRLRDVLRGEATTIVPAGDGLERIRDRVERRRRVRRWVVPSAVLATGAAAAALLLVVPDDGRTPQTLDQASASPSVSESAAPTTTVTPSPTPGGVTPQPSDSWQGPAYWPFASADDLVNVADPVPAWLEDGLQVGQRLVRDVLQLQGVTVSQTCVSCETLELTVAGSHVGTVNLGHYTVRGTRVFTVVRINDTDLEISSPTAGTAISSPTRVTGRIQGVDENVRLRLVAKDGGVVSQGTTPAGSAVPWTANLSWTARDWDTGAILATTGNMRDGAINRVALEPVRRSNATTTSTFAALVDGHVALFDSTTGRQVRQLTYPPAGKADNAATWSVGTLAWVRTATDRECHNELDRLDGSATTTNATTVATSTSVMYGTPVLSPSADWLAWVEVPCGSPGRAPQVVITVQGTEARRITAPTGSAVLLHDITDDGTLLLSTNDAQPSGPGTVGILSADATTLDGRTVPLHPASGCTLASGAAFDGSAPVAFESCGNDVRLVRFTDKGARAGTDASFQAEPPTSISVRDGQVLVWLFGGDMVGPIARYDNGTTTTVVKNDGAGCSSTGDLKGCVFAPDW